MRQTLWAITGAAGFLGSHVVDQLLAEDISVLAIDNLQTGRPEHFAHHLSNSLFRWVNQDIRDAGLMTQLLQDTRPDVVIHLAALHYIPACNANPPETISLNVHGTQCVLTASRHAGVSRLFLASTGDVYTPDDQPHHEQTSPVGGHGIYGLSKLICEQLVALEAKQRPDASYVVGRLFNLYGPRETNPHFLPEVLHQMARNPEGVLKLGNLWPKRDMVPVADAARAIRELMLRAGQGVTTVNIATGCAVSMQQMLDMIGSIRGYPLKIETDPAKIRPVERACLQADVGRLRSLLGWTPHTNLEVGLKELMEAMIAFSTN